MYGINKIQFFIEVLSRRYLMKFYNRLYKLANPRGTKIWRRLARNLSNDV